MWNPDQLELPHDFSGEVRVFPLPNLVMFPSAMIPLHIFETRYCDMLEDSLAGDRLIAMALLQPGWEADYDGRPPIFPVVCVGQIMSHAALDNGRHNILLRGVRRATVAHESDVSRAYRVCQVTPLDDQYPSAGQPARAELQRALLEAFRQCAPDSPAVRDHLETLANSDMPLGVVADMLASAVDFELSFKQQLLTECNVDTRAEQLLARIRDRLDGDDDRDFPPQFSTN